MTQRYRVSYFRTTTERVEKIITARPGLDPKIDESELFSLALDAEEDANTRIKQYIDTDYEFDGAELVEETGREASS